MGKIKEIATIHYNGLIEEFKAIGIDAKIDYAHLEKMWNKRIWEGNKFIITQRNKNNKTIGFFAIFDNEPMIYIDYSYQRQGIGSKLLKRANISSVWIMIGNDKAQEFYRSQGFEPTDSRETIKLGHKITELKWVR